MGDILSIIVQFTVIIGFVCGAMNYGIIKPLKTAIMALKETIDEFKHTLEKIRENQHDIDKRLVAVEASTKSAHHRIDGLEGKT